MKPTSTTLLKVLLVTVFVAGPAALIVALGTPEPEPPSQWATAVERINDGTYPSATIIDIAAIVLAVVWAGALWLIAGNITKRRDAEIDPDDVDTVAVEQVEQPSEQAWFGDAEPLFDAPFTDFRPRVIVPSDDEAGDDADQRSIWGPEAYPEAPTYAEPPTEAADPTPGEVPAYTDTDAPGEVPTYTAAPGEVPTYADTVAPGEVPTYADAAAPAEAASLAAEPGPADFGTYTGEPEPGPVPTYSDIAEPAEMPTAQVPPAAGIEDDPLAAMRQADVASMSDDVQDPPIIVPVRAYYFTRAEDTLRSIAAQFLGTPTRWQQLRALNAASPGVTGAGADTVMPIGTAIALPGDPIPWGKSDPVYLWTLAERFLFAAWGREPTPEEVVPFWRGLTGGTQLAAPAAPVPIAPEAPEAVPPQEPEAPDSADFVEEAPGEPETAEAPAAFEPAAVPDEAPVAFEPPMPAVEEPQAPATEEAPAPAAVQEPAPAEPTEWVSHDAAVAPTPVADDLAPEPPSHLPEEPAPYEPPAAPAEEPAAPAEPPSYQPETPEPVSDGAPETPPAYEPPQPPVYEPPEPPAYDAPETPPVYEPAAPPVYEPPAPPAYDTPEAPAAYEPPAYQPPEPPIPSTDVPAPPAAPTEPTPYDPPLPPTYEPAAPTEPSPYDPPAPPAYEPAAPTEPTPYDPPLPPTYEPADPAPPTAFDSPVPPTHEPAYPAPPTAFDSPVPPTHEPAYPAPPTAFDSPVPPTHEPAYPAPPTAFDSPVPPTHEPAAFDSPVAPTHEPQPDLGPLSPPPLPPEFGVSEAETPVMEADAARMPSFLPSVTGAEAAATAPEAQMVASSNRTLAGTAIGDAMMLWQLSRARRRGPATQADPMEAALRQNARIESLNLIEAAMRQLRAVTVGRLREKPQVLAVRVGAYGFEVLLKQAVAAPEGWTSASEGYVLELPQAVSAADLNVHGHSPSLCPALIPVGDTLEGPLLLNLEEIGCLVVSGPPQASVSLLNAVVATLGSSPLAGDTRIIAVGLEPPAGLIGWENVHSTSFDSPELEELLSTAGARSRSFLDVLAVGPGNDLLIQRAGQVASSPESRLALIGATSSVAARWPWRIHVDDTGAAVVHPIACTMSAAQATPPQMILPQVSQPLSTIPDASLTPPNY